MQLWNKLALTGAALTMLASSVTGCARKPEEYPVSPPTPPPIIEPAPVEQNPVVEYALERDLPQPIIDKLQSLGNDGVNQNEKALIDYLYGISQAEVVSPEVLELAPSRYGDEVTQLLQTRVLDAVLSDGEVSQEEADGLTYLSTFPGKTQRDLIEFGLDDTTIRFLILNSSLQDQDFARYAVENGLCIQDHELTDLERSFLEKPEEYAQVLLNDYLSELSRTYPELAEELGKLPGLKPNTSNSKAVAQESEKVYLLISSSIYESLNPWTDRWIGDVEKTGVQIIRKTIREETPGEIRALLQNTPDLTGSLMVGDIPPVKYEMDFVLEGKPFHEEFPTDLYYMDLDGDWLDADNDGILDTHKGDVSPEIWVGRLKASNLPALGNEMELLKNYFDKNHLYRIGALTLPHRALLYIDDLGALLWVDPGGNPVTYLKLAEPYDQALSPVYQERVVVTEPEITVASDYLKRLDEGWSLVRLIVHSGGFGHHFKVHGEWDGKLFPEDIYRKDPKAFFYTIISCENFDYTRPNYMGGCYVLSKSYSLLAIGDSGIHDVLQVLPEEFFPYLQSECFGTAFLHYLQECVEGKARIDSVHNAIMIGDPLLRPVYNGQDSDRDGLTDQYELAVGLSPYDTDTDHDGLSDLEEAKFIEFLRYTKVHSIEAVEDILELASSNDPEVREAFDLMIKGGTPDPSDFQYEVPNWNTELQALYKLAEQNEFTKDDTLAQAVAMNNGLWVTMGEDEVSRAVYKDTNDLLNFFRETCEIQKARGYYQLEEYPLEAKVALGWAGGLNMHWVGPASQPKIPMRLVYYTDKKLPLMVYQKDTVSLDTMQKMREIANNKGWWVEDVDTSIKKIEDYFYPYPHLTHWEFASFPNLILDENGLDAWLDTDWQFNRYLEGLKPKGDCGTEASFVDAWAKSMGIATTLHWMYKREEPCGSPDWYSHSYAIYFAPQQEIWTAYERQVQNLVPADASLKDYWLDYFLYKAPVNQKGYLRYDVRFTDNAFYLYENSAYTIRCIKLRDTQKMITEGIPTSQMKEWLLYP